MGGVINRPDVLHLFTSQHWVASIEQLHCLGVSPSTIQRAKRARASCEPTLPREYVRVAGTEASFCSRAMSLQLHVGATSFISGVSAGVLHGLRQMPQQPVEITTRQRRHATMPSWGRLVYTSWIDPQRDVQTRPDGVRVARRCGCCSGSPGSSTSIASSERPRTAGTSASSRPPRAEDYLAEIRRSGRGGVIRFEDWLDQGLASTSSEPERAGARRARCDPPGRPAGTRAAVPADTANWRGRSMSISPGRASGSGSSQATAGGTAATSANAPIKPRDRGLRRDRLAHRPVRRVGPGRAGRLRAPARVIYDERLRSLRAG